MTNAVRKLDEMDVQKRWDELVMENIKGDAYRLVRLGEKPRPRDPKFDEAIKAAIAEETKLYNDEKMAELIESQTQWCIVNEVVMEYWNKVCASLYKIDPVSFSLTSIANGTENEKVWEFDSEWEATKHMHKLVRYKFRDHFGRGHDFRFNPLELVTT